MWWDCKVGQQKNGQKRLFRRYWVLKHIKISKKFCYKYAFNFYLAQLLRILRSQFLYQPTYIRQIQNHLTILVNSKIRPPYWAVPNHPTFLNTSKISPPYWATPRSAYFSRQFQYQPIFLGNSKISTILGQCSLPLSEFSNCMEWECRNFILPQFSFHGRIMQQQTRALRLPLHAKTLFIPQKNLQIINQFWDFAYFFSVCLSLLSSLSLLLRFLSLPIFLFLCLLPIFFYVCSSLFLCLPISYFLCLSFSVFSLCLSFFISACLSLFYSLSAYLSFTLLANISFSLMSTFFSFTLSAWPLLSLSTYLFFAILYV